MFRSSVERGEPPRVFEDGAQVRDFVHVSGVAAANLAALHAAVEAPSGRWDVFNVCSIEPVDPPGG
jgi:dTDP-L-rhamnose 4-epimerase